MDKSLNTIPTHGPELPASGLPSGVVGPGPSVNNPGTVGSFDGSKPVYTPTTVKQHQPWTSKY